MHAQIHISARNTQFEFCTLSVTMEKTEYDIYKYSLLLVHLIGIVGNILVFISILRQKHLFKSNYYFVVLQLAICDLVALIISLLVIADIHWVKTKLYFSSVVYCAFGNMFYLFHVAGIGMMLLISALRYRATVHPFKPAISRRRLKVICCLVYVVGLIGGFGANLPVCFLPHEKNNLTYNRYSLAYAIIAYNFVPMISMSVLYYKVGRSLMRQNKQMKAVCSNISGRHVRDQRAFVVCLCTVLCYAIGNLPISAWYIWFIYGGYSPLLTKHVAMHRVSLILKIAGSSSLNPVI